MRATPRQIDALARQWPNIQKHRSKVSNLLGIHESRLPSSPQTFSKEQAGKVLKFFGNDESSAPL